MTELKIARDFALPLDLVTEATAIVATRGAGKSSASAVIVEEGFDAGVQTVVFDRTGVYHGLRSNSKGTGPGLAIYVLGGPNADVPLEPAAGGMIADLVVDSGHSFVLDFSDFSKSATVKFAADFLERLYDRKARARTTTLLVIDEAHFYAPQTPRGGFKGESARLMGAMEDVVGLGRSRGLGVVMTTQRTQALNKSVLDLIETLFIMRMLSPRARDAVEDWIQEKHEDDREGVIPTLESLPPGTAWVWSPLRGILEKVQVRRIKTFDSYYSPKPGQVRAQPKKRRELDLNALGEQMKATVERAKADDPKELRKKIAQLERELVEAQGALEDVAAAEEAVKELEDEVERLRSQPAEVPTMPEFVPGRVTDLIGAARALKGQAELVFGELLQLGTDVHEVAEEDKQTRVERYGNPLPQLPSPAATPARKQLMTPTLRHYKPKPPKRHQMSSNGASEIGVAARDVLSALACFPDGLSKDQLSLLTGRKARGGSWNTAMTQIREGGYADDYGDRMVITPAGAALVPDAQPVPRDQVIQRWRESLPAPAREMLDVMLRLQRPVTLAELAEETNRAPRGGSWNTAVKSLRDSGIVQGRDPLELSPDLALAY